MSIKTSKTFTVKVQGERLTVADLKDLMNQLAEAPDTATVSLSYRNPVGPLAEPIAASSTISVTWTE